MVLPYKTKNRTKSKETIADSGIDWQIVEIATRDCSGKIALIEEEMALPGSRLSVPVRGAATSGADRRTGYTKRLDGSDIGTESRKDLSTSN